MKVPYCAFILLVVLMPRCVFCFCDPFTIAAVGIAAAGSMLFGALYEQCMTEGWIKPDLKSLHDDLDKNLYGQHLVKKIIIGALKGHFTDDNPPKALVMSFHGWTGSGKNYVSNFIAKNLYSLGENSQYVIKFVSTIHFPQEERAHIYKAKLKSTIMDSVRKCCRTLFIFDEIDKMPVGAIDAIKPFIDFHNNVNGIDFRKSIFLFLSNTGGTIINKWMIERWENKKNREEILMNDMRCLIQNGAFNEKGGLHQSDIIQHNLVNYYIPFLPMERKHVELCVKDEVIRRNRIPSYAIIKRVTDKIKFFPPEQNIFSTTGCKGVHDMVWTVLAEDDYDRGTLFD